MIRRKSNTPFGQDVQELYRQWLESKLDSEETLKRYLSYANKLDLERCGCDVNCLKAVALSIRSKSKWYKNAFRNWLNLCFELGEIGYDELHRLRRLAAGGRKERIPGAQHVELSHQDLERISPRVRPYFLLLYYTGIRGSEVLRVKEELSRLKREGDLCYLELNWSRGHKRVYVVFAPCWVFEELEKAPDVSIHYLKKVAKKIGGLKSLRKHWYQKCVEVCSESVCDFIQGRAKTVSAKHYMDLFERAKSCYPNIMKRLEGEIDFRTFLIKRFRRALLAYLLELADEDVRQPPP